MSDQEYILELVRRALDSADEPKTSVGSLVRQATRIASLRHDYAAVFALQLETLDMQATKVSKATRDTTVDDKLRTLLGDAEANRLIEERVTRFMYNRAMDGSTNIRSGSIDHIEHLLTGLRDAAGDPANAQYMTQIDAYFYLEKIDKAGAELLPQQVALEKVLSRIRQSVHDYLVEAESEILSGQTESTLFTRGEAYVTERLRRIAPGALEKYRAAEQRIAEGTSEGFAQALTSCRRIIKALADALYPPTEEKIKGLDGKEREMGSEQYVNRLLQFAIDHLGKSTHERLVEETLTSLGNRLTKLHSLSNKGVHEEVTEREAESCLMWTFFLAADFLRIADGSVDPLSESTEKKSA